VEDGNMADEQQAAAQTEGAQQQFAMQRIYTKDISFESPSTPNVFKKQWQPQIGVDLNTRSDRIDETGNYEVVLTITLTAKVEEETAFLVEVQQAGIFLIAGFEGENLRRIVGTAAPNILFPYARETIDNLCVKGGFPPIMLAPVNFEAMYQQAMTQQQAQAEASAEPTVQ
jgi:preprotein translocase subunit SecB